MAGAHHSKVAAGVLAGTVFTALIVALAVVSTHVRRDHGATLALTPCNQWRNLSDPTVNMTAQEVLAEPDGYFPEGFYWGSATSAFQIEGAVNEDGRGPSIWDTFTHLPNRIAKNQNGDVACDHYHRWEEDLDLMQSLGIRAYRFSVSWSRVLPEGEGKVNEKGLDFYSKLVDGCIARGIEPFVTLYHWDLPQALQDKYGGWLSDDIAPVFAKYADVMFEALGDRVKNWITFNEPWCTAVLGYGRGAFAPGHKDIRVDIYQAAHTQLLAHAAAVKVYRAKYQPTQKGYIGITLNSDYKQPMCNSERDIEAAERAQVFILGWFADPVFKGDYPEDMKVTAAGRLPEFTEEQKEDLKGSADFLGLNHYHTTLTGASAFKNPLESHNYFSDIGTASGHDPNWPQAESGWLYTVPWGFRKMLNWIKERYENIPVVVTENGTSGPGEDKMTTEEAVDDKFRQEYLTGYVTEMAKAIKFDQCDVRGYFHWSFMDNFEWADGYNPRFGLVRVDYKTQQRTPKDSAQLYKKMINTFSPLKKAPLAEDAAAPEPAAAVPKAAPKAEPEHAEPQPAPGIVEPGVAQPEAAHDNAGGGIIGQAALPAMQQAPPDFPPGTQVQVQPVKDENDKN